ncbi:MAG TPA: wax ester/triacylglycerol synthase family O-acyltransferase, partial [Oxalobacteraceae bacterium]|nr:wax ester/triacylglycerol synthase family O-acyltransferase [Oxalobacteraceae bacterium]
SNVPGPAVPLYAAGARMTGYWPLSIVEHGVGLNITLMSYAGTLGVGFTAARCAVADPQELAAAILSEYDDLRRLAAPPGPLASVARGDKRRLVSQVSPRTPDRRD